MGKAGLADSLALLYYEGLCFQEPAPARTVVVAALPILLGFQMLMNAIILDIQSVPSVPLYDKYTINMVDDSVQNMTTLQEETRIYHHVF